MQTKLLLFIFAIAAFSTLLTACSSTEKNTDTAEGAYALAQEYDKDERYEEALKKYQDVKNKFPYSRFATMAELAIADVNFKQESFPEAQAAYQLFKELHPKHPQIDYVTHRLALSYFNQLPATVDRDLTVANNAIQNFDEVINNFSSSSFVSEAREKKSKSVQMLAEKEFYIAEFYFLREKYLSALLRYEYLLKKYPNVGFDPQSLKGAAISANKLGDKQKAQALIDRLKKEHPNSTEANTVNKELN